MSRKTARESVYRLVFEYLFNKDEKSLSLEIIKNSPDISKDDLDYITSVYTGVISHFDEITQKISSCARGFVLDRIYKPDLAALVVAVYEMTYTDVPKFVAISEAVELVKAYSTEKSGSYVNGILASIYKKIEGTEDSNGSDN